MKKRTIRKHAAGKQNNARLGSALAVCMGAALLGACGGKSLDSAKGAKILMTISKMDTYRQTLADGAVEAAKANGASVDVMDAEGIIENQVEQIQKAVDGEYDAILCGTIDGDTVTELKSSSGELPIVFVNSCPKDKDLVKDEYMYVGSSEAVAGQYQAEYVLDKLSGKDEINVVIMKGPNGHSATAGRTKGIKRAFAASGKKVNYVFEDYADWSAERAAELFKIFLKTKRQADCVICNNDTMALGVVQACRDAGIDPGSMLILGVDASADGCAAIQNGEMAFSVRQNGPGQGKTAVEAALTLISGGSAEKMEGITEDGKYVYVPFEKVDASNAAQYIQ